MKIIKHFAKTVIILNFILLLGCWQNILGPIIDEIAGDIDYFPLKVGNTWVYEVKGSSSIGGSLNYTTYLKIMEYGNFKVRSCFKANFEEKDRFIYKDKYSIDLFLNYYNKWRNLVKLPIFPSCYPKIPKHFETVKVPAGKFEECRKITFTGYIEKAGKYSNFEYIVWVAPDVGVVKCDYTSYIYCYPEPDQYETKSYSLKNYSLR